MAAQGTDKACFSGGKDPQDDDANRAKLYFAFGQRLVIRCQERLVVQKVTW